MLAYPDGTNSLTTAALQVHLLLGFKIQQDQLVPSDVQQGTGVQKLQVSSFFAVIAKRMSEVSR